MQQGVCYIVGAAGLGGVRFAPEPGDFVIAADGGFAELETLGVKPDLVLGDFDSLGYTPEVPGVEAHSPVKDDTDMMLAVRRALERGYRRVVLLGGLGGARFDHSVANLQTLRFLAEHGARGWLVGEGWIVTALRDGELRFPAEARGFVSVFCSGDAARGVTLEGLKYALSDGTLTCGMPLGVSNEFLGVPARVRVADGCLFVLWQGDEAPVRAEGLYGLD